MKNALISSPKYVFLYLEVMLNITIKMRSYLQMSCLLTLCVSLEVSPSTLSLSLHLYGISMVLIFLMSNYSHDSHRA